MQDAFDIFEQDKPVHVIVAWNPSEVFSKNAPKGIQLWTEILESQQQKQKKEGDVYTWWGKISESGVLGMEPPFQIWVDKLNEQIQKGGQETHLYMYCGYFYDERPGSLHVGRVTEVATQDEVDICDEHVPSDFYQEVIDRSDQNREWYLQGKLIPYWFKISDIREIRKKHLKNLKQLAFRPGIEPLEGFRHVHFRSPLPVVEQERQPFFCPEQLRGLKGWWQEILKDPLLVADDLASDDFSSEKGKSPDLFKWKALSVARKPEDMADVVAPLLRESREIVFVDPWFTPYGSKSRDGYSKSRWAKVLEEFLRIVATSRDQPPDRLEYHLCFDRRETDQGEFGDACQSVLSNMVPKNWDLTVIRWEEKPNGQPFHARFVLTEKAGVLFEQGLDAGPGEVLVTLLTPHIHGIRLAAFQEDSDVYDFRDEIVVHGTTSVKERKVR